MDIEEKYLDKIWTRINNGDDNRLMLSWDEQFDIMKILKQYHKEQLRIGGVVEQSEQLCQCKMPSPSMSDKCSRCKKIVPNE